MSTLVSQDRLSFPTLRLH